MPIDIMLHGHHLDVLFDEIQSYDVLRPSRDDHVGVLLGGDTELLERGLDNHHHHHYYHHHPHNHYYDDLTLTRVVYWCSTCSRSRPRSEMSRSTRRASRVSASVSTNSFRLNLSLNSSSLALTISTFWL